MNPLPTSPMKSPDEEHAQIQDLLEAIFERYHLDFRNYSYPSIKRRIMRQVEQENTHDLSELKGLVLVNPESMERLLLSLTIHVTGMFRDPGFFLVFRHQVTPVLRTYPYLRIWVAGCSTGEEVYSLAILLHEVGLYSRCRIYATDVSDRMIARAKAGIFPLSAMQAYTRQYQRAGGIQSFAEYYTADNDYAIFRPFLRENLVFAVHNLTGDSSFNEFQVIFCRNVMIYFNRALQNRVHGLFHDSLLTYGYLGLGRSETIRFSNLESCYEAICKKERIYRKVQ